MANEEVTKSRADELLRFLPILSAPDRKFVKEWKGRGAAFPYPEYEEDVEEFFRLAAQEWWMAYDYDLVQARVLLEDDRAIETADIGTIKTLLTYCVRGERFCDGHWASVLKAGKVQRLLVRLEGLLSALP